MTELPPPGAGRALGDPRGVDDLGRVEEVDQGVGGSGERAGCGDQAEAGAVRKRLMAVEREFSLIPLHPLLSLAGVSIGMEREGRQNDRTLVERG